MCEQFEEASGDEIEDQNPRAEFDAELDELLFDGPSLPPSFSRADI
jgi:hypothetical protein